MYGYGYSRAMSNYNYSYGYTYTGRAGARAALTPAQALVQSFQGTGLVHALLVFDPAHYTTPGNTPGQLVDALGGPITYTAPNTQATPTAVQDASGYTYVSADGVDDTLIASANQAVTWCSAVLRSPQSTWSNYGGPLNDCTGGTRINGLFQSNGTGFYGGSQPRDVRKNGVDLAGTADGVGGAFNFAPITLWAVCTISFSVEPSQILQMFCLEGTAFTRLELAALAIRYTDPTADQQSQIEALLTPMQQALLAS